MIGRQNNGCAEVAWTGNLVIGRGSIPWTRSETLLDYLETMKNFDLKINPKIIIPDHGKISTGDIIDKYISYLDYVLKLSNSLKKEEVRIEEHVKKINIPS